MNSVPDQYLTRLGASVGIWKGIGGSVAWRMEGLRRYDLFGDSHGWRRPGTEMFIEPGVSYQYGGHTFTFNVPIGYYYNRQPNPYTGNRRRRDVPARDFPDELLRGDSARRKTPPVSTHDSAGAAEERGEERTSGRTASEGSIAPAAAANVLRERFGSRVTQ